MTKKCSISACDRPIYCAGLCSPCYSALWYANKKGVRWQMTRRTQLKVFEERLESVRPSNVSILRRRKTA